MNSNNDNKQKYIDEMMRYYALNRDASVNTEAEKTAETPPISSPPEESIRLENETAEIREDIADQEVNAPEENMRFEELPMEEAAESEIEFPPPVIPEFIRQPKTFPERMAEPSMPERMTEPPVQERTEEDFMKRSVSAPYVPERTKAVPEYGRMSARQTDETVTPYSEYGYLKIEARTGDNGLPVPGTAITVVRKTPDGDELVFSGVTDESGSVEKLRLPAPPNTKGASPESFQNYAVYTVSAFSKNFYREVSADVPVFSGITSIQRFNMIPVPFNLNDNGQSIINQNTEPTI